MNILKAVIKTVVEVPIAVVKDVVTLGGAITDEKPATPKIYKEILEELND